MILNLAELKTKQYNGLLTTNISKENDCCILSIKDKAIYFSSEQVLVKINIEISDITEEDIDRLITIPRTELLHLMNYSNTLTIKKNNKYHTDSNISGIFNVNESVLYSYSSFSQIFNDLTNYEEYFTINSEEELKKILVASNFTYTKDRNPIAWFVFIENNTVFSSSLFRIYTNKYEVNESGIQVNILQNLLPIVSCYPFPIVIKKMNKSIAIVNDKVNMVCSNIEKVDTNKLISDDRFIDMKNNLLANGERIQFNIKPLIEKLDYLKWYAKDNKNFRTTVSIKSDSVIFNVKENECIVPVIEQDIKEEFSFNFNVESLLGALKGRYNNDELVTLFVLNNVNIFCFRLGDEEYYYSSKIVE
jgi:hypothetical protein